MRLKQVAWNLVPIYVNSPSTWHTIKNKLYETLGYWFIERLKFEFLEKDLRLVSAPHFVYDFLRRMFPMLYSINWPNFIVLMPLLLEILDNICIGIVCFPGCDVKNFETIVIFPIKPLFYMTRNVKTKI